MSVEPLRVTIVGGGITGLSAAYHLRELGAAEGVAPDVIVLESSARVGGLIRTDRIGDYLIEGGPDALLVAKPGGVELCERLGLADELTHLSTPEAGTRILHRGRLLSLPKGFLLMAPTKVWPVLRSPLFSIPGKVRMGLERFVPKRSATGDESLASFVTRRFGREVLDRAAEPVVASLFTADAERLSVDAVMPRFVDAERRYGSVTRALADARRKKPSGPAHGGHGAFAYLKSGFGRIVDELVARLPADTIRTSTEIGAVHSSSATGRWTVVVRGAASVESDAIVLACPAHAGASLLEGHHDTLAAELRTLRYASCATVSLVYERGDVAAPLDGFGFFVPRVENSPVLACSFVSVKFPDRAPAERVLLRVFLGGALHPETLEHDDTALVRIADEHVRGILEIGGSPVFSRTHRFPGSMPQYEVGWTRRLEAIREHAQSRAGLFLAGSAVGAFGLPDCISSGQRAARDTLDYLAQRATQRRSAAQ